MNENYDNTNKGAIWKNDNSNPNAPQYKGQLNVEGEDFQISAWRNKTDNTKAPVLRFQIQRPSSMPNIPKPSEQSQSPLGDVGDDDVPF